MTVPDRPIGLDDVSEAMHAELNALEVARKAARRAEGRRRLAVWHAEQAERNARRRQEILDQLASLDDEGLAWCRAVAGEGGAHDPQ